MDVASVLREARRRAGFSQRVLAQRAGTQRSVITEYESGRKSPTVATLSRLLEACGLQGRLLLEPLKADVDARVDALLGGEVQLRTDGWSNLVRTLDDHPDARHGGLSRSRPHRDGPVTWAFDAASALALHGLAVPCDSPQLVAVWDDAARSWLRAVGAMGFAGNGQLLDWREVGLAEAAEVLRWPTFTMASVLQVRLVTQLPTTVRVAVAWHEDTVPVLTVDEVERGCPEHAEVLARWRERRTG